MAIIVNVHCIVGFLPDIILLTLSYFHEGTGLNTMKSFFCRYSLSVFPPKCLDSFLPVWGILRKFRCVQIFLETVVCEDDIYICIAYETVEPRTKPHFTFWLFLSA